MQIHDYLLESAYNQYVSPSDPDPDDDEDDGLSGLASSYNLFEFPEELIPMEDLL